VLFLPVSRNCARKDADGNYLWQPPAGAGQPATLMSFPVVVEVAF
jgi:HK97 family phage major capsid protein